MTADSVDIGYVLISDTYDVTMLLESFLTLEVFSKQTIITPSSTLKTYRTCIDSSYPLKFLLGMQLGKQQQIQ